MSSEATTGNQSLVSECFKPKAADQRFYDF